MLTIIISTCLVTNPTVCHDHKIPVSWEVSAIQCMKHAQPYVAQWNEEHPRWRVIRWQCRPASEHDI